jgi:2,4-dienoyl-CoA reductase-like NADH-dependent reductase (Old Yellow Enzyme family)
MLIPSCGFTARTSFYMLRGKVPILDYVKSERNLVTKVGMALFGRLIVKEIHFKELFLFDQAKRIKDAVKIPVACIGGVCSLENMDTAMREGFEFVQIGRATIRDPNLVKKMQAGEITRVDCDHCNRCVAAMAAQGVRCISEAEESKRKHHSGL